MMEMMSCDEIKLKAYDEDISLHFDWLSFVIPLYVADFALFQIRIADIIKKLCLYIGFSKEEIYEERIKKNNYEFCLKIGLHIAVRYGGEYSKMNYNHELEDGSCEVIRVPTMQIEFTGQGCREIEERGKIDYYELLRWIICDLEGHCRRLDLACDDKVGFLPISWVKAKIEVFKDFTTRFRTPSGRELPFFPTGSIEDGYSILFGSRNSTMMLMIYDKKKERAYREDPFMGENWVRWELRFLGEKSQLAVDRYLNFSDKDMGKFYFENLTYMLQIKQQTFNGLPTTMIDKRKWDLDARWDKFTNQIKGVPLTMTKLSSSDIDRKLRWRDKSLSRMHLQIDFAEAYDSKDNFMYSQVARFIHELEKEVWLIREGKVKDSDLALINAKRKKDDVNAKLIGYEDLDSYMQQCLELITYLKRQYEFPF